MAPVTLVRAKTLFTCHTVAPQQGISNEDLGRVDDAAILYAGGVIEAVGARRQVEKKIDGRDVEIVELGPCVIVPGFVDGHAHPLYAGNREPDFVARASGLPPPLGMAYTVHETRKALEHPLLFWELIERRLKSMLAHGTTTLETKTGYALHKPGEGELLSMIDAHKDDAGIPRLVATFLGAHALPPEFFDEIRYIDYLIDQVIPIAKAHGAVYADAFCEPGYFSPAQTRRYLESARAHGLRLRVHCDEMGFAGAAEMAVDLGVDAVDHCNYIREQDVRAIAAAGIVTVACPATIEYLGLSKIVPVRSLLQAGATVALASDFNPGTSPCFNLQSVAYFARQLFGLSAQEALYGVTRGGAASLRLEAGSLRAGRAADFVALGIESIDEFGWQFGGNLATAVVRGGVRVA